MLQVRNLVARYGDFQALFGVDLDLRQGAIVALIGANGAGKSTFLKSIAGQIANKSGEIQFNNEEISGLPSGSHRARWRIHGAGRAAAVPLAVGRGEPEGRRLRGPQGTMDPRGRLRPLSAARGQATSSRPPRFQADSSRWLRSAGA